MNYEEADLASLSCVQSQLILCTEPTFSQTQNRAQKRRGEKRTQKNKKSPPLMAPLRLVILERIKHQPPDKAAVKHPPPPG